MLNSRVELARMHALLTLLSKDTKNNTSHNDDDDNKNNNCMRQIMVDDDDGSRIHAAFTWRLLTNAERLRALRKSVLNAIATSDTNNVDTTELSSLTNALAPVRSLGEARLRAHKQAVAVRKPNSSTSMSFFNVPSMTTTSTTTSSLSFRTPEEQADSERRATQRTLLTALVDAQTRISTRARELMKFQRRVAGLAVRAYGQANNDDQVCLFSVFY